MAFSVSSPSCFLQCSSLPRNHRHRHDVVVVSNRYASSLATDSRISRNVAGSNFRISNFYRLGAVGRDMEAVGVPTSVPVRVANELLQAGHRYLDVRTPEEFRAGHPAGSINIPYMYGHGSGMYKNPDFLKEVALHFQKHDEIIVGCQSGKRSLMAASELLSSGYTGITDISGGYAAWTQNGLPVEM